MLTPFSLVNKRKGVFEKGTAKTVELFLAALFLGHPLNEEKSIT